MDYQNIIDELKQSLEGFFVVKKEFFEEVISKIIESLKSDHKILVFGNGGSAAQSQHFTGELVNKFLEKRPAIRAISLTTDTSSLTSIANDTSFDFIFSRQIEALGKPEDVLLCISTSGNSPNLITAAQKAKEKKMKTVGLLGRDGGELKNLSDLSIIVPSSNTPRIQETHICICHILCELVEKELFG